MQHGTEKQIVACELGRRPPVLVAAVKAMTFAGIHVQAFQFDPDAGPGTGYFLTDAPAEARDALARASLNASIIARKLTWSCRPPDDPDPDGTPSEELGSPAP